jgi:hypothetical protein
MVVEVNCEDDTPNYNDNLHIYEVSEFLARSEGKLRGTL